jgi:lipoprotein-anchoring transpeptidase ErfK/SrfK
MRLYPFVALSLVLFLAGCVAPPARPRIVRKPAPPGPPPVAATTNRPALPPVRPIPPPPHPPVATSVVIRPPALPFRTVLAVQTCIDRVNFSCGYSSGEMTDQAVAALKAWQGIRGLPVTGQIDDRTLARCGNLDLEFVTHTVTEAERASLGEFPTSWAARADLPRAAFVTILELVAEKYHASEAAIQRLNPQAAWPNPPAGTVLTVPKAAPAKHVDVTRIVISLSRRQLQGFDAAGKLVLHFPCSIARDVSKRPVGELKIVNAASDPIYTFDPAVFPEDPEAQAIGRQLILRPGPNNPVGVAWLGLSRDGYGIHGTAWPEDIGKTESHGCFRLANWNAAKLVRMVKLGTPVIVEP